LNISPKTQNDHRLIPGVKIDFWAKLKTDKGRIVFYNPNEIELTHKDLEETFSEASEWDFSKILVAKKTGTEFDVQPEKCFACAKGILLDISEEDSKRKRNYRHLFCLQGIKNPKNCIYDLKKKLECKSSSLSE